MTNLADIQKTQLVEFLTGGKSFVGKIIEIKAKSETVDLIQYNKKGQYVEAVGYSVFSASNVVRNVPIKDITVRPINPACYK